MKPRKQLMSELKGLLDTRTESEVAASVESPKTFYREIDQLNREDGKRATTKAR